MTAGVRTLSAKHTAWLEERGIDPEIAVRMGLYSATAAPKDENGQSLEPVPHDRGNILVFPFRDRGVETGAKYRAPGKRFWQRPASRGGRKNFYNADVLDDPEILAGRQTLATIASGFPWVVSVPDGAPADRDRNGNPIPMRAMAEITPEDDHKFEFVVANLERLKKVQRIVLAGDGDGPGQRLNEELARRLGKVRCSVIAYPQERIVPDADAPGGLRAPKDLDEVRRYVGGDSAVRSLIDRARPVHISGLYTLMDFETAPDALTLYSTGFAELNPYWKLYFPSFTVVSGVPSAGKSTLINQIVFNLALRYGFVTTLATFEAPVRPTIRDMLTGFFTECMDSSWDADMRAQADAFIERHFKFITDSPFRSPESDDESMTIERVLDLAEAAVQRYGSKITVIDPWNEIEQVRRRGEMRDEYAARAIRECKYFARRTDSAVILVAHPTKAAGEEALTGKGMSLYDISDGAMFANKAEVGVIVEKSREANAVGRRPSSVHIRKMKFHKAGREGTAILQFNEPLRMFDIMRASDDDAADSLFQPPPSLRLLT
jgi:twinkle protein